MCPIERDVENAGRISRLSKSQNLCAPRISTSNILHKGKQKRKGKTHKTVNRQGKKLKLLCMFCIFLYLHFLLNVSLKVSVFQMSMLHHRSKLQSAPLCFYTLAVHASSHPKEIFFLN